MAIFKGDPSGSPNKKGMTVISYRNYNIQARDPLGIPQFFSFSTEQQQLYGNMPMMARIGMHKSHVEY